MMVRVSREATGPELYESGDDVIDSLDDLHVGSGRSHITQAEVALFRVHLVVEHLDVLRAVIANERLDIINATYFVLHAREIEQDVVEKRSGSADPGKLRLKDAHGANRRLHLAKVAMLAQPAFSFNKVAGGASAAVKLIRDLPAGALNGPLVDEVRIGVVLGSLDLVHKALRDLLLEQIYKVVGHDVFFAVEYGRRGQHPAVAYGVCGLARGRGVLDCHRKRIAGGEEPEKRMNRTIGYVQGEAVLIKALNPGQPEGVFVFEVGLEILRGVHASEQFKDAGDTLRYHLLASIVRIGDVASRPQELCEDMVYGQGRKLDLPLEDILHEGGLSKYRDGSLALCGRGFREHAVCPVFLIKREVAQNGGKGKSKPRLRKPKVLGLSRPGHHDSSDDA